MAPPPLLLLLLLLPIFFSAAAAKIPGCEPYSCGSGGNITYPFWYSDKENRSSYCGYPRMDFTCKDGFPTWQATNNLYRVTKIDTASKTVSLVDADVLRSSCPRVRHNLTYYEYYSRGLSFSPSVFNLTFFFGCNSSHPNEIPCITKAENSSSDFVLRDWEINSTYGDLYGECKEIVVAPLLKDSMEEIGGDFFMGGFGDVLKRGFQLRWEESEYKVCRECETSGGFCGYRNDKDGFVPLCYCAGRVREGGTCLEEQAHQVTRGIPCKKKGSSMESGSEPKYTFDQVMNDSQLLGSCYTIHSSSLLLPTTGFKFLKDVPPRLSI